MCIKFDAWRVISLFYSLLTYATDGISCFYLIILQAHSLFYKLDLMINFLSTNSEKLCQFALRHSNLSLSLTNNTHTIAPLKKNFAR